MVVQVELAQALENAPSGSPQRESYGSFMEEVSMVFGQSSAAVLVRRRLFPRPSAASFLT